MTDGNRWVPLAQPFLDPVVLTLDVVGVKAGLAVAEASGMVDRRRMRISCTFNRLLCRRPLVKHQM